MIKIPMRGAAEISTSSPSRKQSKLRKYKQNQSGEAKGRSNYYSWALGMIRRFHKSNNSQKVVNEFEAEMKSKLANDPTNKRLKAKVSSNLRAVSQYIEMYGKKEFVVCSGKKLLFASGDVAVSAKPDLVVTESGQMLLLKLNLTKNPDSELMADIQLHFMYAAALNTITDIGPSQVVYLQPIDGSELRGPKQGFPPSSRLITICKEIETLWGSVSTT